MGSASLVPSWVFDVAFFADPKMGPRTGGAVPMATDSTMLHALITCKKVVGKELKSFQNMWDDLQMGRQIGLSKAQKAWVEKRYNDLDLDGKPLPPPPEVKVRTKVTLPWEKEGHQKALKPPGRS